MTSHSLWGVLPICLLLGCQASKSKNLDLSKQHKPQEMIITLREGETWTSLQTSDRWSVEAISAQTVVLKTQDAETDLQELADELLTLRAVRSIEPNYIYHLNAVPNDPDFSKLYGLRNDGLNGGLTGADMGMLAAWDTSKGSADFKIGIIDSGVDYNHPDLKDNMWKNPGEMGQDSQGRDRRSNGLDDDGNGFADDWQGWDFYNNDNDPMDDNSHGTHVAGTIGARGNNGVGVVGVNWVASLAPIKVFSAAGESSSDILIKAIDYATQIGVIVTNNSWGGGGYSDAMYAAIQRAQEKNILFVAAAGNNGTNNDSTPHYPSSYALANVISVAATDRRDALASFSNYGAKTVMVAAPGVDIWSTLPNNRYGLKSGTSMATPHVTGLVALIKSAFPLADAALLKQKVLQSADILPQLQTLVSIGRVQASNALEIDLVPPAAVEEIELKSADLKSLQLSWKETGDDGLEGRAKAYAVRWSLSPIISDADWDLAKPMELNAWQNSNGRIAVTAIELPYNTSGYLAVRATDNVGNWSAIGVSFPFALKRIALLWNDEATDFSQWGKVDQPFGIETQNSLQYFADSPSVDYENNIDIKMESRDFPVTEGPLILDIRSRYDLESNYDFASVELSLDQGINWQELARYTGKSDWVSLSIPLRDRLQGASVFRIRLRLKTDYSIAYGGWDVDRLQLIGPQL